MSGSNNRKIFTRKSEGQASVRNFIENSNALVNVSGWLTYADAAQSTPVDGTGGTAQITFSRTTTDPLSLDASFQLVKDAANRQGQGVSYDFTTDRSSRSQMHRVSFDYELVSGTYDNGTLTTDSDLTVWVYDVTNSQLIPLYGNHKINSAVSGVRSNFVGDVQLPGNSASYRLIIHEAKSGTSAFTINLSNISVNRSDIQTSQTIGPVRVSADTASGTLNSSENDITWTNETVDISSTFVHTTGIFTAPISGRYEFDLTIRVAATFATDNYVEVYAKKNTSTYVGTFTERAGGVVSTVSVNPKGSVDLVAGDTLKFTIATTGTTPTYNGGSQYNKLNINFVSATQGPDVVLNRPIVLDAGGTPTGTLGSSYNTIVYGTVNNDTANAYNASTGVYTVPVTGYYNIAGGYIAVGTAAADTSVRIRIYKNNTTDIKETQNRFTTGQIVGTASIAVNGVYLAAGDTIRLQSYIDMASSSYNSTNSYNYFNISLQQGREYIASNEQIVAIYESNAGTSYGSSTTIVNFEDLVKDTHNAVATGGSWAFTCPATGDYEVTASLFFVDSSYTAGQNVDLYVFKNGSQVRVLGSTKAQASASFVLGVSSGTIIVPNCIAGDTINVRTSNTRGSTATLSDANYNYIMIRRVV